VGRAVSIDLIGRDVTLSKTLKSAGDRFTDLRKTVENANRKQRASLDQLGTGATIAGTALVAGFGLAVKATMDFDKAMSNVGAVSNASAKDLEGLRQAALKAGKDTVYSATQAAQAEAELAKVGISAADIMGGALTGSLSLAAAGQLDLEEAATLSGQAMKIFNLEGKDVGRIADALAAGANKSAADVHQLGESLRAGGQIAAQTGLDLEDTVGVLAAFSDNALIGSDAGTSLKTMLMHLANPTAKSKDLMDELGISAYDAAGNFVGISNLAGQLQTQLSGLTQQQRDAALAQIFGSDAMRGAAILYKIGADGVDEYTKAVSEQGAASKVAAKNLDNLAGDLEQLKGSLETALIQGGSQATGALRTLTQAATDVVNAFNNLPTAAQGGVVAVGGISGAALLAAGGFIYLIPKIAETRAAMATLGITADTVKTKLATLGKAALWITAIVGTLSAVNSWRDSLQGASASVDNLTKDLQTLGQTGKLTGSLVDQWTGAFHGAEEAPQRFTDAIREMADPTLWEQALGHPIDSMADALPFLDGGFQKLTEKVQNVDKALAGMAKSGNTDEAAAAFQAIAKQAAAAGIPMDKLKEVFPEYTAAAGSSVAKTAAAAQAQQKLAADSDKATTAIAKQNEGLENVRDTLDSFKHATGDADMAQMDFRQNVEDLTAKLKTNGNTFKYNTTAGRENRAALIGVAQAANEHALKVYDETGSVKKANTAFQAHVEKLKATLRAAGLSEGAIKKLIERYLKVPPAINKANDKIKTPRNVKIGVYAEGELVGYKMPGGTTTKNYSGGEIPMVPGGSRHHDSVNALLRVGEHVWTPEEVDKVGGHQKMLELRRMVRAGKMQRFATGGAVGSTGIPTPSLSVHGVAGLNSFAGKVNTRYNAIANEIGQAVSSYLNKVWGGPGRKAVQAAKSQIGVPYSWGGGGPGGPSYGFAQGANIRGFDCSSLMQYSWYKATGKTIPRTTYGQYPWAKHTSKPKPGDLGFMHFGSNGQPGHVAMYAGKNRMVEAPFTGARVRETAKRPATWGRPPIGRWRGGPVKPGQTYLVGERGPETFETGSPGRINPTVGGTYHFHNHGAIGSRIELENWLARSIDNLDRQGRLPSGTRR
jgi:TP901 family phage tail tape measure protein